MSEKELCEQLDQHSFDWSGGWTLGALLRTPGAVIRVINQRERLDRLVGGLALGTFVLAAIYGAILGLFVPGWQTLYAAAKIPTIILGTAFLCTPTFYIFNAVLGADLTFRQSLALILGLTSAAALILCAFAPIAWFFTASTDGFAFLSILHILIFLIAFIFGVRFLNTASAYLSYLDTSKVAVHQGFLRLWFVIVIFVGFQMAYVLRPLMTPGPFYQNERGLFFEFLGALVGA